MKYIIYILAVLFLFSCKEKKGSSNGHKTIVEKSVRKTEIDSVSDKKEIVILSEDDYEVSYPVSDLKALKKFFLLKSNKNEFLSPDLVYENFIKYKPKENEVDYSSDFASEAGQDDFFILYSYFLKEINGKDKFASLRDTISLLYNTINSLNSQLNYGGTMYGHKTSRIYGYTEYSIYKFRKNKNQYNDFKNKKTAFIKNLKKFILNEEKNNDITTGEENIEMRKYELMKIVSKIESLITNKFLLNEAKNFQEMYY